MESSFFHRAIVIMDLGQKQDYEMLLQVQSGSGLVLVLRLFDKGRTSHGPEWYTWCVVLLKTDFFTRS